jgi:hypothetical protein
VISPATRSWASLRRWALLLKGIRAVVRQSPSWYSSARRRLHPRSIHEMRLTNQRVFTATKGVDR